MSKTTITPVHRPAFEADRETRLRGANIRGAQCRAVKGSECRELSWGKWIDVLRAYLRGKPSSLLDSSGLHRERKSTSVGTKGHRRPPPKPPTNHRFNPRRIIHRWRETTSQFYNQLRRRRRATPRGAGAGARWIDRVEVNEESLANESISGGVRRV